MRKTLIPLVSALAIANLLALIGAVGFLFGTGRLDADRVERITEKTRRKRKTSPPK